MAASDNTPPPARLLDITRLMRRVGKVLTGVDRVEHAYLTALINDPIPVYGLIRAQLGYILLGPDALAELQHPLAGPDRAFAPDAQKRRTWRRARKLAMGRVPPALLGRMLRGGLPRGTAYINVGHSNLTDRVLTNIKSAVDGRITVLIHDAIPLDFPQYQRPETHRTFADMLGRVVKSANLVVFNSQDTLNAVSRHVAQLPTCIVAHLGVEPLAPKESDIPDGLYPNTPFFLCLGTIEPRKNHALLLDLWDEMGPDAPGLVIAGNRGWQNEAVFARLDALPADGPVREVQGLSDGAVSALMAQCSGLLFPSFAEGYGLPAVEAAAMGTPILANDLPVFREILGDILIYADVSDRYLWINKIKEMARAAQHHDVSQQFVPPTWQSHFKTVLTMT